MFEGQSDDAGLKKDAPPAAFFPRGQEHQSPSTYFSPAARLLFYDSTHSSCKSIFEGVFGRLEFRDHHVVVEGSMPATAARSAEGRSW